MDAKLSTVTNTEQITEKIGQIEARMDRFLQVMLFQYCAAYGDAYP